MRFGVSLVPRFPNVVKGRPIYYGEPDDGTQGYFVLARAIIRRTLLDAQLDPACYTRAKDKRIAEELRTDAQRWIADVLSEADSS